jgi:hypothetical protein
MELSQKKVEMNKEGKWTKTAAIACVVIIPITAIGIWLSNRDGSTQSVGRDGFNCGANATCSLIASKDPDKISDDDILEAAKAVESKSPEGLGPWPFVVGEDGGIGLKVRTSGERSGIQIGGLASKHVAWVDCQMGTDFDPGSGTSVWLRLRWPKDVPAGGGFYESEPAAAGSGFANSRFLFPIASNREVPQCKK